MKAQQYKALNAAAIKSNILGLSIIVLTHET